VGDRKPAPDSSPNSTADAKDVLQWARYLLPAHSRKQLLLNPPSPTPIPSPRYYIHQATTTTSAAGPQSNEKPSTSILRKTFHRTPLTTLPSSLPLLLLPKTKG
jgi:hypothetical protein